MQVRARTRAGKGKGVKEWASVRKAYAQRCARAMRACGRAGVHADGRACKGTRKRACVRACVRARVCACVRTCKDLRMCKGVCVSGCACCVCVLFGWVRRRSRIRSDAACGWVWGKLV